MEDNIYTRYAEQERIEYIMSYFRITENQATRFRELEKGTVIPDELYNHLNRVSDKVGFSDAIFYEAMAQWIKAGEPNELEYSDWTV